MRSLVDFWLSLFGSFHPKFPTILAPSNSRLNRWSNYQKNHTSSKAANRHLVRQLYTTCIIIRSGENGGQNSAKKLICSLVFCQPCANLSNTYIKQSHVWIIALQERLLMGFKVLFSLRDISMYIYISRSFFHFACQ